MSHQGQGSIDGSEPKVQHIQKACGYLSEVKECPRFAVFAECSFKL